MLSLSLSLSLSPQPLQKRRHLVVEQYVLTSVASFIYHHSPPSHSSISIAACSLSLFLSMDRECVVLPPPFPLSASTHRINSWRAVLMLAYQSFGVVYGDMATSPLYVYKSTLSGNVNLSDNDIEIFGVLSFIFWTLTLVPVVKYVLIVLTANDNGEGGTFALYSLLCRHAKLSLLPNLQAADEELSTYKIDGASQTRRISIVKSFIEKHQRARVVLLIFVLFGTCMVIGDGVLTPTISVLSAVSGIKVAANNLEEHLVVTLSCLILVCVFALQRYGTHRVGFIFSPIVIAWLFCISVIGIYNVAHWNPAVIRALSPYYMYTFLQKTGRDGWISLGGVMLCITGAEAMFADLGHFSQLSIKIAFMSAVYPALVLNYMGQAAFLSRNHGAITHSFYNSIPKPVFWPVFIVATLASIVGSQAIISATFSIIKQCLSLGCFPNVKVVHTSKHIHGQIYLPEINWILMLLCLAVTVGFKDTNLIGNAYGLAVITVMLVTTCLMSLVIFIVWQKSLLLAVCFLVFFGSIELLYISASLIKVPEGGWVPLVLSLIFMSVMYVWHYGLGQRYKFDFENKVSMKWLLTHGPCLGATRVPGIGLIYTELVTGVPAVFSHLLANFPTYHRVLVFVCIKSVPVPYVPSEERFLVGRIGPKEHHIYRCIVRYGYKDVRPDDCNFENELVLGLAAFIQSSKRPPAIFCTNISEEEEEAIMAVVITPPRPMARTLSRECNSNESVLSIEEGSISSCSQQRRKVGLELLSLSPDLNPGIKEELQELIEAKQSGVTYILGHYRVRAKNNSSTIKKFVINKLYNFLQRNSRDPALALNISHVCLIEVGMIYHV